MEMPGRKWVYSDYRYSHNGQQDADEVFVGAQTAEYWMYDSRIGRRWEIDPLNYVWQSPYATFNNNPILYSDILGLKGDDRAKQAESAGRNSNKPKKCADCGTQINFKSPNTNGDRGKPQGERNTEQREGPIYLPQKPITLQTDNTTVDIKLPNETSGGKPLEPLANYTDTDVWFMSYNPNLLSASFMNTQNQPYIWSSREPSVLSTIRFPNTGLTSIGIGVGPFGGSYNFGDGSMGFSGSVNLNKKHDVSFSYGTDGGNVHAGGFDFGFYGYGTEVERFSYKVNFTSENLNKYVNIGGMKFFAAYKIVSAKTVYKQTTEFGNQAMHIVQTRFDIYQNTPYGTVYGPQYTAKDTMVNTQTIGGGGVVSGAFAFPTK